jgi:fructose-1,6-bisphosphatase
MGGSSLLDTGCLLHHNIFSNNNNKCIKRSSNKWLDKASLREAQHHRMYGSSTPLANALDHVPESSALRVAVTFFIAEIAIFAKEHSTTIAEIAIFAKEHATTIVDFVN